MHDARVPALREKLGIAAKDNDVYDRALADAVSAFQKEHELRGNGELTAATVDALNGPRRERTHEIDTIVANMERWRWLPPRPRQGVLDVEHPGLHPAGLQATRQCSGRPASWSASPSKPTPLLTETMKFITINPTWNVPPSIVYNEYLPALQQDPTRARALRACT